MSISYRRSSSASKYPLKNKTIPSAENRPKNIRVIFKDTLFLIMTKMLAIMKMIANTAECFKIRNTANMSNVNDTYMCPYKRIEVAILLVTIIPPSAMFFS